MQSERQTNKKFLALASVMFFAPFVQHFLKIGHVELFEEDKNFIRGYIKFGYTLIALLVISIIVFLVNVFLRIDGLDIAAHLILFAVIAGLLVGSMMIFLNQQLFNADGTLIQWKTLEGSKEDVVVSFLPFYNVYLWQKLGSYDRPFWWVKESLIWWFIIVVIHLTIGNNALTSFLFVLLVIRVSFLAGGMDILNDPIKIWAHHLFRINLEELWGYLSAPFVFLFYKIKNPTQKIIFSALIDEIKTIYQQRQSLFSSWFFVAEYCIGTTVFGRYVYQSIIVPVWEFVSLFDVVILGLIAGRYLIMAGGQALPFLPIIHEIIVLIQYLRNRFQEYRTSKKTVPEQKSSSS